MKTTITVKTVKVWWDAQDAKNVGWYASPGLDVGCRNRPDPVDFCFTSATDCRIVRS